MGTTLTVAVSLGRALLIGHVGDSRAYMLRGKRLHQLTRDDTLAQDLIDAGIADPEDTATRAMRHVLTAAIGSTGKPIDPQVQRLRYWRRRQQARRAKRSLIGAKRWRHRQRNRCPGTLSIPFVELPG